MEEITLTEEQLRLVPREAMGAKAYRLSSISSLKLWNKGMRIRQPRWLGDDVTFIFAACEDAIVVHTRNPNLRVLHGQQFLKFQVCTNFLVYTDGNDRAAADAVVALSQMPEFPDEAFVIVRVQISAKNGNFTEQDLATILTNCYPATVLFQNFEFATAELLAWTRLERPISIAEGFPYIPRGLLATFLESIILHHQQTRTSFGKLDFASYISSRNISLDLASQLSSHDSVIFDKLIICGYNTPLASLQKLLECRRAIRSLELLDSPHRPDSILSTLAYNIAHGTCPACLDIQSSLLHHESIVAALESQDCRLEGINVFDCQARRFATALAQNMSLKYVRFHVHTDFADASVELLEAIVGHPTLQTIYLVADPTDYGIAAHERLVPLLRRNRQLRVVFRPHLEDPYESMNSFGRFHCGVADVLPAQSDDRRTFYVSLALRYCSRDAERTAVLLKSNVGPLLEILSERTQESPIARPPGKRRRFTKQTSMI